MAKIGSNSNPASNAHEPATASYDDYSSSYDDYSSWDDYGSSYDDMTCGSIGADCDPLSDTQYSDDTSSDDDGN